MLRHIFNQQYSIYSTSNQNIYYCYYYYYHLEFSNSLSRPKCDDLSYSVVRKEILGHKIIGERMVVWEE